MIHVVIGTKAQLVKMAPVLVELKSRNLNYNFIFTGQHQETMEALRGNFNLADPDITLHSGKDITSIPSMLIWIIRILWQTLTNRKKIFKGDKNGVVLVHGDTFSTRSFDFFHPFPEELTRVLTFYLTDIYFCPGATATANVSKFSGLKINTEFNTLIDSLEAARKNFDNLVVDVPAEKFCVVTTHRFENIFNKKVLEHNLTLILLAADKLKTIFIMHPITEQRLKLHGLLDALKQHPNIECRPRYDYFRFMKLVYFCEFLISDGGSNQEECWFMGKPCLLLRKVTEHPEGLDTNVVVSKYSTEIVQEFINNYEKHISEPLLGVVSPSKKIIDSLLGYA
jgi:UDP-N-acetylglucosamine 2-epimerase (non-hydrolysing)